MPWGVICSESHFVGTELVVPKSQNIYIPRIVFCSINNTCTYKSIFVYVNDLLTDKHEYDSTSIIQFFVHNLGCIFLLPLRQSIYLYCFASIPSCCIPTGSISTHLAKQYTRLET